MAGILNIQSKIFSFFFDNPFAFLLLHLHIMMTSPIEPGLFCFVAQLSV